MATVAASCSSVTRARSWSTAESSKPIRWKSKKSIAANLPIHLYKSSNHVGDFIECVRSRKRPICDVEIGCRSATVCHLGNLAYWYHRRLKWDPAKERFIGDEEANTWLDRKKRAPWDTYLSKA